MCTFLFTSINNNVFDEYRDEISNLFFVYLRMELGRLWIEEKIENQVCEGGTSLFVLAQIAIYMGFTEIYLLGVDFSFSAEIDANGIIKKNNEKQRMQAQRACIFAYGFRR